MSKVDNEAMKMILNGRSLEQSYHLGEGVVSHLSTNRTLLRPPFNQESDKTVLIARGRTYNAISPLLLGFSIQMLDPQISEATNTQPYGPSK